MNQWYKRSYRRNLVDMHIENWDPEFLSKFDAEEYAGLMKTANVKSVMVYLNSHVGYCYYPTEIGYEHEQMRGEKMGKVIELCRAYGMDIILYYSLIFNNWAYKQHPDWRQSGPDGEYQKELNSRMGTCCINSPGYREFVDTQVKEIITRYGGEGIFFDMASSGGPCYCKNCVDKYKKETGKDVIPTEVNWNNPDWVEYQDIRKKWVTEFAKFAYDTAKKYDPEITVEHNSSPFRLIDWRMACSIETVNANDYIGGDIYGEPIEQSLTCKYFDAITPNKPFEYMTSRCDPELANHTTTKPKELLELNAFYSLVHNGAFLFIDAIDPKGTLNPKVYEMMGEVFQKIESYEKYAGGISQKDVGLYLSMESDYEESDTDFSKLSAFYKPGLKPHLDGLHSATRVMKENNIPFWVLTKNNLEILDEYQIIMMPDVKIISENERKALLDFVKRGGSLYISGGNLPELLKELTGMYVSGITKENVTYMVPAESGIAYFEGINLDSPLMFESAQVIMEGDGLNEDEVLAKIMLPYTNPNDCKFASIHSNPPGKSTDYPAIIRKKYGLGKVIWSPAALEKSSTQPHRDVFVRLIKSLTKKPFVFESDAPKPVEIIVHYQPENYRYTVSVLNAQQNMPPIPVYDINIELNLQKIAKAVRLLPKGSNLNYTREENKINFTLSKLDIFEMIEIEVE